MDEKLIGILVAAAGVTATEAAELASTDEGIATLEAKTKAKLADVKDNSHKLALKKTREAVEAALKAKGIEAPSFEKLADHLDELEGKTLETANAGKLTDEQILKHPAVVSYKNQLTLEADRKVQAAKQEATDALATERQAFQQQQTDSVVRAWAKKQVQDAKPLFSANAKVAANQEADLVEKLVKAAKWKTEGDLLQMLDDEGELLKDAAHNIIQPETKAREIITSYYELPVSSPRDTSGLTQAEVDAAKGQGTYAGPKTDDEYAKALNAENDREKRTALTTGYRAYQKESETKG